MTAVKFVKIDARDRSAGTTKMDCAGRFRALIRK